MLLFLLTIFLKTKKLIFKKIFLYKVGHDFGKINYLENYECDSKIYNYSMSGGIEFIKNSYHI